MIVIDKFCVIKGLIVYDNSKVFGGMRPNAIFIIMSSYVTVS